MPGNNNDSKRKTYSLSGRVLVLVGVLLATVTALLFVFTARTTPWTSFVPDLDHDGSPDVETHASLDKCVEHIRSLKVHGTCGLQCNVLNHCVTRVQVAGDPIGAAWRSAPGN